MKRFIAIIAALLCLALPAAVSAAYNPLSAACGSGGGVSGTDSCKATTSDPISGPNGALKKVSLLISIIAGVAAVIVIVVGGFMFITSGGDPQKAASARSAVIGAVVGLVIIAAAETIVIFVVSKT